jgi:hypothetical protein
VLGNDVTQLQPQGVFRRAFHGHKRVIVDHVSQLFHAFIVPTNADQVLGEFLAVRGVKRQIPTVHFQGGGDNAKLLGPFDVHRPNATMLGNR